MEVFDIESVKCKLDDAKKILDDEVAAEKALAGGVVDEEPQISEVDQLSRGQLPAEPSRYQRGSVEHWTATAAQMVNVYCSLHPEPDTQAGVAKLVSESPLSANSVTGVAGKTCVMIHFDCCLFGEAKKRPHLRHPTLPESLVKKLIWGALGGRGASPVGKAAEPDCPIAGDCVFICDAGRPDVETALFSPFTQNAPRGGMSHYVEHAKVTMCLAQDGVEEKKKKKARGVMNQVMTLHILSSESFSKMVPERKHLKFPGTSRGNCLAWVTPAPAAETWTTTYENKKAIYGSAKIFGSDAASSSDAENKEERKASDVEPVFYNYLPMGLYANHLSSYSISGVLDLTSGQGELAKASLERRVPYVGFCLSESHCVQLKSELVRWLKGRMATEGSSFYSAEWAKAAGQTGAVGQPQPKTQAQVKAFPGPRGPRKMKKGDGEPDDDEEADEPEAAPQRKKKKTAGQQKRKLISSSDEADEDA